MRLTHICHLMMLVLTMNFSLSSGRGQCDAFALTNEENDFVSRSIANRANHAVWNDRERGALHCFFGLDTVVWRAGRLDSIFWGKELRLPLQDGADPCGVYENTSVWLHRGQIQLYGPATGFSSGSDWLTCNPATGWERLEASGKAPLIRSGLCSSRIDNDKILFFSEDGRLAVLNLSLQVWEDAGVLTDKFVAYFGEFSVLDLSDYIMLFGELGGGLIKKSTMQLVTNYDLRFDLLRSAQSWSTDLNKLSIQAGGAEASGEAEVLFDADLMYAGGASMPFSSPASEPQEEVVGSGRIWTIVSMLFGLLFGALGAMLVIRKRSDVARPEKRGDPSDLPVAAMTAHRVGLVQHGGEEGRSEDPMNLNSLAPELSHDRLPQKVKVVENRSAPEFKTKTVASPKRRKSGLVELLQKFLDSEMEMYTAVDLNAMLGIEAEASEESQRARRARMLKQLNAIHTAQTGKKLILRERDPNDRRHLLYRINR